MYLDLKQFVIYFYNKHIALRMSDHITSYIFYTTLHIRKITAAVNNIFLKYVLTL